ncbi:immunoglobulin-like domain-containing protein [Listeria riparia]|uniref:Uncharacterized protein n=1 Tax=Listeria riparia FSL S10-1204 TaxID=1265816 RepID=W7D5X7_9LIST|nr:immunoglobulin-like domain-containing protein [Listeria riparia]EUJ43231.1 hypothetical protein PRIP_13858 [Listeria riparia FSL S10-1204]
MKKKTMKILTGLLAFNVVASTPLTLLSTIPASASQMKLNSAVENTKKSRSVNVVNLIDVSNLGDKAIQGYESSTNAVTLTKDGVFSNGYIVTKQKVNLKNSFTLKTKFGIGGGASKADGISFFMQNASTPTFGGNGDSMRLFGLEKTLGIAFRHQTWYTPARNNISFYTKDSGFFKYQNSFPSGSNYDVTINWDSPSKTLSYNYAGKTDSYTVSDMNKVFGGTEAIIGFTGVTGQGSNTHVLYSPLLTVNSGSNPEIKATDQTINLGENFIPLQGVSANDVEDGDLTSQIKVVSSNVDTNKLGSYTVTYSVTDQNDNTTLKSIKVNVILPAPELSDVYDNSDYLIAKGYPNAELTVILPDGTRITKTVNAQGEAAFAVSGLKENEIIRAFQSLNGQASPESTTIVKGVIPDAPTISPVTTNDTIITVTGEANAKITLSLPDGTELIKTADANGKATFLTGTQKLGDVIRAIQTGVNGKSSDAASITVTAGSISAPTIASLTTDDNKVTGTGLAGATITILANNVTYTGVVATDGTYSITIPKQAADTIVTATQTKNGVTSESVSTKVIDNRSLAAPTINDYYINDGYVSGTAPVGAKKITIEVAGKVIRTVDVAANGTYKVYVNDNAAMRVVGTTFQAYAIDGNGKAGDKATSTVKAKAAVTIAPPTINDYMVNSGYVSGKATSPATQVTISVGGKTLRTGDVAADGTFRIYVNDNVNMKVVGTEFTAIAKDASGNVSSPTTAKVKGTMLAQPTIDPYYAGQTFVTGKTDKATNKIALYDKAGNLLRYGAVDAATGTYKVYVSDKVAMHIVGDTFSVKAMDTLGTATAPTTSTILTALLGKPSINAYHKGDDYVTGRTDLATYKIGLYDDQGTLLRTGLVNPDGTYKIYALDKAFMQVVGDNFTVRAINTANIPGLAATSQVLGERVPSEVTAVDYNLGDNNVTGTFTGAGAKVQLFVNGELVKNGALNTADGTYQVYAKDYIKATTDKVEVVLYDKNWQELDRTVVTVKAAAGETLKITPDTYAVGDPNVTGSLDGACKSIKLYVNGVFARTGQISEDGKSFIVYAQDKITSETDTVSIVGIDKDGKEVTASVTVKATSESPDALKIESTSYTLNTDNLTGSYTGIMNGVELWVNGVKVRTGGFDEATKTFSIYAKDKITSTSDIVQLKGYDKNWNIVTANVTIN